MTSMNLFLSPGNLRRLMGYDDTHRKEQSDSTMGKSAVIAWREKRPLKPDDKSIVIDINQKSRSRAIRDKEAVVNEVVDEFMGKVIAIDNKPKSHGHTVLSLKYGDTSMHLKAVLAMKTYKYLNLTMTVKISNV